jgi:hypothetical protein
MTAPSAAPEDEQTRAPDGKRLLPASPTPWLVFLIAVLWHTADRLIIPPLNRLLEANICRIYYREHDPSAINGNDQVPEDLCKGASVQIQLALLLGAIQTIGLACGQFIQFPCTRLLL